MSGIHSNLKSVLIQHDPNLSIRRLAKEINYHFDSVRRMYKDEMVQYPRDLLLKLCTYFNVEPGKLIIINNEEMSEDSAYVFGGGQEEYMED
jgi:DNA-binding Xre family transcriptional regulator